MSARRLLPARRRHTSHRPRWRRRLEAWLRAVGELEREHPPALPADAHIDAPQRLG